MITETAFVHVEMSQSAPRARGNAMQRRPRILANVGFLAAALATAGGLYALTRRPWTAVSALVGFALTRWQLARWFTQTPLYTSEGDVGLLEVRDYPELLVAETTVITQHWRDALDEGFRRLVEEVPQMTVPVLSTVLGDSYTIAFVLPENTSLEDLAIRSSDIRVSYRRIPAMRVAVLRYRGTYDGVSLIERCKELYRHATLASLEEVGEPLHASYDAPSTLPALRRQELWLPIAV